MHFNDAGKVSRYAAEVLCWAVEDGVINGIGGSILDPQGLATRAQTAQMLMNFLKKQDTRTYSYLVYQAQGGVKGAVIPLTPFFVL